MFSLNRVEMIGNLGRDPEVRRLNNGNPVVTFSIALGESWKDKSTGEKKQRTEWVNVVCFNENLCKIIEDYCKTGSPVYVSGKLRTRKYPDQGGGKDRYATEVVLENFSGEIGLLGQKGDGGARPPVDENSYGERRPTGSSVKPAARDNAPIDDDIPF
jgi:single-strand DNA-binding protein